MKVILVQDVEKVGKAGEVKEVSGGFGRNYLIPQGFAMMATKGLIKQAEERLAAQKKRQQAQRRDAEAVAAKISGQTLRFVANVGDNGRLYGSVTAQEIADKLAAQISLEVDRRKIELDEPIKRTGAYAIKVRVASDLEPVINVIVEGEAGSVEATEQPADTTAA